MKINKKNAAITAIATALIAVGIAGAAGVFNSNSNSVLIGNTNIEPSAFTLASGKPEAFRIKASASGVLGNFNLWVGRSTTAKSVIVGFYSDSEGHIGTLINSNTIASPKYGEWNSVQLSNSDKIENNKYYWLALLPQNGTLYYRDGHQPCSSDASSSTNLTALPSTWENVTQYPECIISAYITAGEEISEASKTSPTETTPVSTTTIPTSNNCTFTTSNISQINSLIASNAVICLAEGTYGNVSITTTPTDNSTIKAAPGAKVTVNGVNIAASNITVSQLYSTGTINVGSGSPYPGFTHDTIEHNDVGPTNGFGISVLSSTSTPSSFITIKNNEIHNTSTTGEGDALRFDGWNNIVVEENDIYNIKECSNNTCHTDTLQSYQGEAPTSNLIINKNYTHDNIGAQGLPFLKDGDISNVTISNNLSLRNSNTNGQVTGIWVDENIKGLKIVNNTYQGTSGSIIQSDGSASGPTVEMNHNVFDNLNIKKGSGPAYSVNEDYDIFTGNDEYTFNIGPHSKLEAKPEFMNTSIDDYRLKNNPNNIGINWVPSEIKYGPTGE